MSDGPHPKSIEAWNALFDRYDDKTIEHAAWRFIDGCRRTGDPMALKVAGDLMVRLAVSRKLGFKRWPPLEEVHKP